MQAASQLVECIKACFRGCVCSRWLSQNTHPEVVRPGWPEVVGHLINVCNIPWTGVLSGRKGSAGPAAIRRCQGAVPAGAAAAAGLPRAAVHPAGEFVWLLRCECRLCLPPLLSALQVCKVLFKPDRQCSRGGWFNKA